MRLTRKPRAGACDKANVTVEFALVATFILLPLLAGGADFLTMITAQAQLNTALQALYYYAWTNQEAAEANTSSSTVTAQNTLIAAINSTSIFHITLAPGTISGSSSNLYYACVSSNASASTVSALQPYSTSPASTCPSGQTLEEFVQYTVSTRVTLPFPLPLKLKNPFPLSATGSVQI